MEKTEDGHIWSISLEVARKIEICLDMPQKMICLHH